jgi:hypothetical protein
MEAPEATAASHAGYNGGQAISENSKSCET